jgi:hypothetical protein
MMKALIARLFTAAVIIAPVVAMFAGAIVPPGVSWT